MIIYNRKAKSNSSDRSKRVETFFMLLKKKKIYSVLPFPRVGLLLKEARLRTNMCHKPSLPPVLSSEESGFHL